MPQPDLNHKGVEADIKGMSVHEYSKGFKQFLIPQFFMDRLVAYIQEQKEAAVVAELEKILAARSLATDLKEYTDIIKSRLDQLKSNSKGKVKPSRDE